MGRANGLNSNSMRFNFPGRSRSPVRRFHYARLPPGQPFLPPAFGRRPPLSGLPPLFARCSPLRPSLIHRFHSCLPAAFIRPFAHRALPFSQPSPAPAPRRPAGLGLGRPGHGHSGIYRSGPGRGRAGRTAWLLRFTPASSGATAGAYSGAISFSIAFYRLPLFLPFQVAALHRSGPGPDLGNLYWRPGITTGTGPAG